MSRKRKKPRKMNRQQRRERMLCIGIIALCFVATLGYLKSRLWVLDLSYHLQQLRTEEQEARHENRRLRLEVARLKSPERISHVAKTELKLKRRSVREKIVVIDE